MFLDQEGNYSRNLALLSHKSSGVPGTVDGLIKIFNDYGSGNFTLDEICLMQLIMQKMVMQLIKAQLGDLIFINIFSWKIKDLLKFL